MKRKTDPRHKIRTQIFQRLFEWSFRSDKKIVKDSTTTKILSKREKIDKLISEHAPAWPLEQIAPADLAILRLAIWELLFKKKEEPYKVVIDEAVEIAKEYGSESSPSFVNGVLGSVIKSRFKIQNSK